jgi:glycosyltransferase involved in cell wall biosynthesis
MRIVFDMLGSTEKSGGMRLHSTELIRAWIECFPEDGLTLVGGAWAAEEFSGSVQRVVSVKNEGVVGRALGQLLRTPLVGWQQNADAVISLSPIVSPLVRRERAYCFQHDWRHKKNPHEFPVLQRAYRKLWEVSAKHAAINICISEKAQSETRFIVPGSVTTVIENGWDHARRWMLSEAKPSRNIVTFGHHNNKRPELLIRALASMDTPELLSLVVLGARGPYADDLRQLAEHVGVTDRVQLPGFISQESYEALVSSARVIALASSDEGFGLPIAEAAYFGIPALITSDSGMHSIFGSYPQVAEPTPESLARGLEKCLQTGRRDSLGDVRRWNDVVHELRQVVRPVNAR